jgi:hypothetical protein
MPPGAQAETCKGCHKPGRTIGDPIRVIREYADDEANTETMTALQMHMSVTKSSPRAIHWHADPSVRVEYVATDAERQTIPYVRVTDARGQIDGRWTASIATTRSAIPSRPPRSRPSIGPWPPRW